MGKKEDLENQLKALKAAQEALLARTDACMRAPDKDKTKLWDAVVPLVKTFVEARVHGRDNMDVSQLAGTIYRKTMETVLGEGWEGNLERF